MIVVPYIWKHLDTGNSGCCDKVFFDLKHFKRVLGHWNYQHPSKWSMHVMKKASAAGDAQ